MILATPFRRAVVLALAWWLVGLGIDLGAGSRVDTHADPRPAASGSLRVERAPCDHNPRSSTKSLPTTSCRTR